MIDGAETEQEALWGARGASMRHSPLFSSLRERAVQHGVLVDAEVFPTSRYAQNGAHSHYGGGRQGMPARRARQKKRVWAGAREQRRPPEVRTGAQINEVVLFECATGVLVRVVSKTQLGTGVPDGELRAFAQ